MNKVFLSGMIAGDRAGVQPQTGAAYLTFVLAVRHKNAKGITKQELYRVNAWNNAAAWGNAHLRKNQLVALEGYLTQRSLGSTAGFAVEITAETFLPGFSVSIPPRPAPSVSDSTEVPGIGSRLYKAPSLVVEKESSNEKNSAFAPT